METVQLDLLPPKAPAVSQMDLGWMLDALRGKGWLHASDLGADTEAAKRKIRAIARASKGEIISGQQGYHLTREAKQADYLHGRDWLCSQADEMRARVIEIDRVWHNRPQRGGAHETS
jgi:hypothetical protein